MQVDPIKPKLKPPGIKHLKVRCDILLSKSAFKFNLRRYRVVAETYKEDIDLEAGAYTRPLFGSTV